MKLNKEQKLYLVVMAALFVVLDIVGVSNGDKIALSLLVGAVGPLFLPKLTEKLLTPLR